MSVKPDTSGKVRACARALALAAALLAPTQARADYPDRSVEITVTFAPGGMPDLLARALAEGLSAHFKQPFVVANRLGAAGAVGGAYVSRAEPNGYNLLFAPALIRTVVPLVAPNVGYKPESLQPVCQTFESQMALVVRPDSPFKSVRDIIDAAKQKPGGLSYGHAGIGSIPHLTLLELADHTQTSFNAVPFKGDTEVVGPLLGGHIDFAPMTLGSVPRDAVRIVGIFADARNPGVPDVPTVKEQGFAVSPTSFGGLFAPAGLPHDVTKALVAGCKQATEAATYRETAKRALLGSELFAGPEAFSERVKKDEIEKARLLKTLGYPK